jgi:hypothetical protein
LTQRPRFKLPEISRSSTGNGLALQLQTDSTNIVTRRTAMCVEQLSPNQSPRAIMFPQYCVHFEIPKRPLACVTCVRQLAKRQPITACIPRFPWFLFHPFGCSQRSRCEGHDRGRRHVPKRIGRKIQGAIPPQFFRISCWCCRPLMQTASTSSTRQPNLQVFDDSISMVVGKTHEDVFMCPVALLPMNITQVGRVTCFLPMCCCLKH